MYHEIERRCDEAIHIGEIIVRVVDVEGTRVTLAVSRPEGPRYQEIVVNLADENEIAAFSDEFDVEISTAR